MTTSPATAHLFLGVDGGGTKTAAVVVDADGCVRGRGTMQGSNQASVGTAAAVTAILEAARSALRQAGTQAPCDAAWIGVAGVHSADEAALLREPLVSLARSLRISNDAELLLGALVDRVGVVLISGTGSIACGRNRAGESARCGGWGHIFGDEGSAYGLGSTALRAVARAADGRGHATALTRAILHEWQLAEPSELIARVYLASHKAQIAALAPLVLATAEAGDDTARAIVRHEASALARQGIAVANRLRLHRDTEPVPVALGGRLLTNSPMFREQVVNRLKHGGCWSPIVEVEEPALEAARALRAGQAEM